MPELHKLTSPINVLQDRGLNIALVTDGRMSGASGSFPALIHAISENLNLYRIQDGDQLTLDLKSQTFLFEDQIGWFKEDSNHICPKILSFMIIREFYESNFR